MRSAAKSAAFGGVLLAMIEGLGILLTRATAPPPAPPMMEMAPGGAPLPQPGQRTLPDEMGSQKHISLCCLLSARLGIRQYTKGSRSFCFHGIPRSVNKGLFLMKESLFRANYDSFAA